jgi:hypothetical protein
VIERRKYFSVIPYFYYSIKIMRKEAATNLVSLEPEMISGTAGSSPCKGNKLTKEWKSLKSYGEGLNN